MEKRGRYLFDLGSVSINQRRFSDCRDMALWKLIEISTTIGVLRAFRGSSYTPHSLLVAPNKKRQDLRPQEEDVFHSTTPAGRRKIFLLPQQRLSQWETHNPDNEKPLHSISQFLPMDFLFITAPPNPLFLYKGTFFSFVLQTCLWFCHSLPVLNCNSLLFLNEPTLFCW